jgi:6-phosphogluconolactonase
MNKWILGIIMTLSPLAGLAEKVHVYVGTYTRGESKGIYHCAFDSQTGALENLGLAAETPSPSFLKIHPNRKYIYAVNESGAGSITAFAIDSKTGTLSQLNQQSTHGGGPCHLAVDRAGRFVITANYTGGNLCVLPIKVDGSLGEAVHVEQHKGSSVNPKRQKGPHAHSIDFSGDDTFAISCDLGLDKALIYRFDGETGKLVANDPAFLKLAPGAGPRHFALHPDNQRAYVLNEINSTITACNWNGKTGALYASKTVSTLPEGFAGNNSTAEIFTHPGGKFVYASNRGHDSIAVFSADLALIEHESIRGKTPRNFAIDPTGAWLLAAGQNSNTIAVFRIDSETGKLEPVGDPTSVPTPVCIMF